MSFAFLPLYTGDYLRDTQHLSCSEHGIFLKFLMHCWDQRGPLPRDERKLHGICNARSGDEIEAMRRVLGEFFTSMEDGWYNKRMQEEICRAQRLNADRRSAGLASAEARRTSLREAASVQQVLNRCSTVAGTPTTTTTTTTTKSKSTTLSDSQKPESDPAPKIPPPEKPELWDFSAKPDDRHRGHYILAFLNHVTGSRYRGVPANLKLAQARAVEYSLKQLRWMVNVMQEKWRDDPKMAEYLRPKTLFSALNCAQYIETARREEEDAKATG